MSSADSRAEDSINISIKPCGGSFMEWVSTAEQLHASLPSSVQCQAWDEVEKACRHWTLEQWKPVLCLAVRWRVKFVGGGVIMVWGCFIGVWLGQFLTKTFWTVLP